MTAKSQFQERKITGCRKDTCNAIPIDFHRNTRFKGLLESIEPSSYPILAAIGEDIVTHFPFCLVYSKVAFAENISIEVE